MVAINEGTGDRLVSKANSKAYQDNFDSIFGKKDVQPDKTSVKCPHEDSGGCYKSFQCDTNAVGGICKEPEECPVYKQLMKTD